MHIFEGKSYVVFCFENLNGYDTIKLYTYNSDIQSPLSSIKLR